MNCQLPLFIVDVLVFLLKRQPHLASQREHCRVLFAAACQHEVMRGRAPVYDASRAVFTYQEELPGCEGGQGPLILEVIEPTSDMREVGPVPCTPDNKQRYPKHKLWKITLSFSMRLDLGAINDFIAGKGESRMAPRHELTAIDICLRQLASADHTTIGRSLFYPNDARHVHPLGGDGEVWIGHFRTVKPTQQGLMLNVDAQAIAMIKPMPLLEYLCLKLRRSDPRDIGPRDADAIYALVSKLKIETTHQGGKRRIRVHTIAEVAASRDFFDCDGQRVSVQEYFGVRYNTQLRFPGLPCLKVGSAKNPASMPIELCRVAAGQRMRGNLTGEQIYTMLRKASAPPKQRVEFITMGLDHLHSEHLKNFDLEVSPEMEAVQGRILKAPDVSYVKGGREAFVSPVSGRWDLPSDQRYAFKRRAPAAVKAAAVVFGDCLTDKQAGSFLEKLQDVCVERGMGWSRRCDVHMAAADEHQVASVLEGLASKKGVNLIFCFVAGMRSWLYAAIKRTGDTSLGVATQCFDASKILDRKRSGPPYQLNVAMKINAKLGGWNHGVRGGIPIVKRAPTLVMAADVYHPPSGDERSPSIAAIVGSSTGEAGATYETVIQQQEHRIEPIARMEDAARQLRDNFVRKTGSHPKQVVMYRDGVADSQISATLSYEVTALRRAFLPERPKLTVIITQKRNKCKLFVTEERDADSSGNVPAGTVVDSGIVHPTDFDFYMVSHLGLKGTSKPSHYWVVVDDANNSTDDLQAMTYALCHTYCRARSSVSMPAPAYYAHLAAYRGRYYSERGAHPQKKGGSHNVEDVHPKISNTLWYA